MKIRKNSIVRFVCKERSLLKDRTVIGVVACTKAWGGGLVIWGGKTGKGRSYHVEHSQIISVL